jgi:hypothetical protein
MMTGASMRWLRMYSEIASTVDATTRPSGLVTAGEPAKTSYLYEMEAVALP